MMFQASPCTPYLFASVWGEDTPAFESAEVVAARALEAGLLGAPDQVGLLAAVVAMCVVCMVCVCVFVSHWG